LQHAYSAAVPIEGGVAQHHKPERIPRRSRHSVAETAHALIIGKEMIYISGVGVIRAIRLCGEVPFIQPEHLSTGWGVFVGDQNDRIWRISLKTLFGVPSENSRGH
jgi:hypothetical protein